MWSVCSHTSTCRYFLCVCGGVHTQACGGHGRLQESSLETPASSTETCSPLVWELTTRLGGKDPAGGLLPAFPGDYSSMACCLHFLSGRWRSNPGPYACKARAWLAEPSPPAQAIRAILTSFRRALSLVVGMVKSWQRFLSHIDHGKGIKKKKRRRKQLWARAIKISLSLWKYVWLLVTWNYPPPFNLKAQYDSFKMRLLPVRMAIIKHEGLQILGRVREMEPLTYGWWTIKWCRLYANWRGGSPKC